MRKTVIAALAAVIALGISQFGLVSAANAAVPNSRCYHPSELNKKTDVKTVTAQNGTVLQNYLQCLLVKSTPTKQNGYRIYDHQWTAGTTVLKEAPPYVPVKKPQTISFTLPSTLTGDQFNGLAGYPLTATSTSNLPVTYTSSTPAVCEVTLSKLIMHTPGTCSVTALQQGNTYYLSAPSKTISVQLSKQPALISVSIEGSNIRFGKPTTIVARVYDTSLKALPGVFAVIYQGQGPSKTVLKAGYTDANGLLTVQKTFQDFYKGKIGADVQHVSKYASSTNLIDVAVSRTPVTMSMTSTQSTVETGIQVTYSVNLVSDEPAQLGGHTVRFVTPAGLQSIVLGQAVTDSNGVATFTYSFGGTFRPLVAPQLLSNNYVVASNSVFGG